MEFYDEATASGDGSGNIPGKNANAKCECNVERKNSSLYSSEGKKKEGGRGTYMCGLLSSINYLRNPARGESPHQTKNAQPKPFGLVDRSNPG